METVIIKDFFLGGIIAALFSYIVTLYEKNPEYIKIAAYIWGIPTLYFILLFVAFKEGNEAALDVSRHGLLGVFVTAFTISLTLLLWNLGKEKLIYMNIFILFASIFFYALFKIYKL